VTKPARFSTADAIRAHKAAEKVARVAAWEIKPDGTIRVEFGEAKPDNDDWRDGSPLYEGRP
jgi:hypothetical protein